MVCLSRAEPESDVPSVPRMAFRGSHFSAASSQGSSRPHMGSMSDMSDGDGERKKHKAGSLNDDLAISSGQKPRGNHGSYTNASCHQCKSTKAYDE